MASTRRTVAALKGFLYEIQGAAYLSRQGRNVLKISQRFSVPWKPYMLGAKTGRSDLDVVIEHASTGEILYYQFKSGANVTLTGTMAWVRKMAKFAGTPNDYSKIRYALPNGTASMPDKVAKFLEEIGVAVEEIPLLD